MDEGVFRFDWQAAFGALPYLAITLSLSAVLRLYENRRRVGERPAS